MQNTRNKRLRRKGATAVEFALTAPLLFAILFGAMELGHANMISNVAEAAAYEGARQGIVPGATAADCINAANGILQISGVRNAAVTVVPANLATSSNSVSVQISIPYASNAIAAQVFTNSLVVNRRCQLIRESL